MLPKSKTHTLRRTVALVCAACAGLGLAAGTLRAQSPVPDPNPSPAVPTPYSSPIFHAGGALTPPPFPVLPPGIPFPDPLYGQLQGTPTGLVPGTLGYAGTTVSTEIPSFLLGDYLPTSPPTTPGVYFPNHFRDGTAFSWSAPLTFLTPQAVAPATSPTGALLVPNVESTPTAVNITEYPFIQNMHYIGTVAGTASTADTNPRSGTLTRTPTTLSTTPLAINTAHLIRQVVYFGRSENISVPTVTNAGTTVTNTPVGAIYCVDGFTGEVIWRYQTSSYSDGAVFSAPAVAYINVLTDPTTMPPTYANKAVVIVGDNNGFVYCLDAIGNGDGTSNISAATPVTGVPGTVGFPIYGVQPTYPSTASPTTGSHVGTTGIYWAYRPDPTKPQPARQRLPGFNASTPLPVPGPFGVASPNIYIQPGISTTPAVTTDPATKGALASNAVIYLGNTRDCVYALDGLGVANNLTAAAGPLPAYNASLPGTTTQAGNQIILGTGIPDNVPTCNPRWWFTPDNGRNTGISFESTPAVSQTGSSLTATIVTATPPNQIASGSSVTFTATISDSSGNGGAPTGSVLFSVDGVAQTAAVALSGGAATFTPAAALPPGRHLITAAYSGDANFSAGSNNPAFDEEVESGTAAAGSIVITSAPANPSTPGQAVTFTAAVADGAGAAAPTGTVTFFIDGAAQTPAATATGGTATSVPVVLAPGPHTITATYTDSTGVVAAPATSFEQYVYGLFGPVVYIGSSQELGATSNAGRIYALDGLSGPTYATTATAADRTQRARWAYPNLYATGSGNVVGPEAATTPLPVRPALGNISGSPVVFTNTDDVVPAVGIINTPGYIPAHPRTRIYFAANSGLEVPYGTTTAHPQPNPRPASDTTGRVWAIETNGTTAYTTEGTAPGTKTVWSFPEANDPNNVTQDFTPEPSPPMGAFLDATPAMGFVQFPTTIQYGPSPYTAYTHTDSINTTSVLGKSVPMLYIGTNGTADLGFYALDVNGGTDAERGVYRLESPTGSSFTSSPVLVTNSSTTGGNGGAVYATSGNTLLQITATPISNINTAQAFAFVGVDAQFSGGGPISGPAVAAADTTGLVTGTTTTTVGAVTTATPTYQTLYGGKNATDFVYFGDGTLGFCRGITPIDANYGGAAYPPSFGGVTDVNQTNQYSNKFFLQAYLFDGTTDSATDRNMGNAIPLNNQISGFEWGGFAYVRIGNVVPPCPATDIAAPTAAELVADPTDPTLFYGNGQAVSFSVGNSTVTIPALNPDGTANVATALTGAAIEKVFVQRTDPTTPPNPADPTQLVSASNQKGWLAAYSYPIGSANTRIGDFPGAFRRIREATQTATIYTKNADGTYTATGKISLIIQTTLGSQYSVGNPPTALKQTPPTEQPTFGILNPLAVVGYGIPLALNGSQTAVAQPVADPNGAGPFGPLTSQAALTIQDRAAFSNGSNYIKTLPSSGYNPSTENPTDVTASLREQADAAEVPILIVTSVGDIPDGGNGTNVVPGGFGLQVENRSLIGTKPPTGDYDFTLFPALNVAMQQVNAHWNDNTIASGTTQNGPGATVNPLPWEDLFALSSVAINASQDYPDIPASAITHTLFPTTPPSGPITGVGGSLDVRAGNLSAKLSLARGSVSSATPAVTDTIEVSVTPPPHQPANLQVWDAGNGAGFVGPKTPETMNTSDRIFPQGYIEGSGSGAGINASGGTPQRVFVDIGGHGRFPGSAISTYSTYPYREVQSFAGVPVDMRTEITGGTVSLGDGPSSLGIQTEQYTPPDTYTPLNPSGIPALFDPYNQHYQPFFKPLTVLNEGNTNLLNAQFNQQSVVGTGSSALQFPLMAYSDANDPLSGFGGFDYNSTSGPLTSGDRSYNGTAIALPGALPINSPVYEQPFLLRSSLDTDLMRAYGQNPGLLNNTYPLYPGAPDVNVLYARLGATFHKPRVGVASTTLTVPDVPDTVVPVPSGGTSYNLPVKTVPAVGSTAPPYVGISVPFGTPVGPYATTDAQPLRLFEGQDFQANGQFYPPLYSGAIGGHQAQPSSGLVTHLLLDSSPVLNPNAQPLLPASSGVKLNITVLEDRLTDGYTAGALPMIDAGQAGLTGGNMPTAISTPDFAPAAFRDPITGNLSVYWTSGRTPGSFNIFGTTVPFTLSTSSTVPPGTGYFSPASPQAHWWNSIGGYNTTSPFAMLPVSGLVTTGTNSGLSIAPGPTGTSGTNYAFDVAVSSTAPYRNTLYSYLANPATGTLTGLQTITPTSSASQVKYGVKGLYTGTNFTNSLWAFWTGSTRGRTGLYYNSQVSGTWGTTVNLLPVPAGLTAVADASPMLMTAPVNGTATSTIEVTYSGTAPDGNIDLYVSRYIPAGTTAATASQLNLAAFPAITENLAAVGGWYQARDVAWSRTGALNVSVTYPTANGPFTQPLLYNVANVPQFTKAIYDKASGLLVLTGVHVPYVTPPASPAPQFTVNTVYVDSATGRVRFSPALILPTRTSPVSQSFGAGQIRATFSPEARRLTIDSRADTAPVTFMDLTNKHNDAALAAGSVQTADVEADRRWTIWRKSGAVGSAATLYYKTQRLTLFLPTAVDVTKPLTVKIGNTPITIYDLDYLRGRLYFQISAGVEGQNISATYTDTNGKKHDGTDFPVVSDTVQWQDEFLANDTTDVAPLDTAVGSATVIDTEVRIIGTTNENNVAAFLDPFAGVSSTGVASSHKVWLFWNSTRNGTADIYSETIDPRFAAGP